MRVIETPIGVCCIEAADRGLVRIRLQEPPGSAWEMRAAHPASRHEAAAARALREYFDGERQSFADLVLAPEGSAFQLRVWRALCEIPFGSTESYGDLARRIDAPGAARAVGMANHHNPLWVVVPCHRVIAADGSLGGYGGGIERKRWLLEHEGSLQQRSLAMGAGMYP